MTQAGEGNYLLWHLPYQHIQEQVRTGTRCGIHQRKISLPSQTTVNINKEKKIAKISKFTSVNDAETQTGHVFFTFGKLSLFCATLNKLHISVKSMWWNQMGLPVRSLASASMLNCARLTSAMARRSYTAIVVWNVWRRASVTSGERFNTLSRVAWEQKQHKYFQFLLTYLISISKQHYILLAWWESILWTIC